MTHRMIIIGGGIIGASFAWHAHKAGIDDLIVVTADLPGDDAQATSGTWGWINGYADDDPGYAALRLASLQYWPEMIAEIDHLAHSAKGAFIWDLDDEALPRSIQQHRGWGHDVAMADEQTTSKHLQNLKDIPDLAGFGESDLALEGRSAARAILDASKAHLHQTTVTGLIRQGDRVTGVDTEHGPMKADDIILTAGLGTAQLLGSIEIDFSLKSSLGLLAYTDPLPPLLNHPVTGLDFHARQDHEGRLVIGGAFGDNAEDDPNPAQSAQNLVRAMADRLDYDGDITLSHYTLGRRPLPVDGRPKIGRMITATGDVIKGLYVAVMHSGMTNAAITAKLGMAEILSGKRDPLLNGFEPTPKGDA